MSEQLFNCRLDAWTRLLLPVKPYCTDDQVYSFSSLHTWWLLSLVRSFCQPLIVRVSRQFTSVYPILSSLSFQEDKHSARIQLLGPLLPRVRICCPTSLVQRVEILDSPVRRDILRTAPYRSIQLIVERIPSASRVDLGVRWSRRLPLPTQKTGCASLFSYNSV